MITFGSLFTGIGGLDLGLERAGMQCKWQVEIDEFCLKVLEKHWPNVKRFKDIKDCDEHNLEPVDLICGGFPCQPVSSAARGRNVQKSLWPEFYRIIGVLRPCYIIVENPEGLRYADRGFRTILEDLATLRYNVEWECLPAAYMGAPHRRTRIWLVAYSNSNGKSDLTINEKTPILSRFYKKIWKWPNPPANLRVAHGIPSRVDRLKALGNAVVPQVAEFIGRRIIECHLVHIQERDCCGEMESE